MGSAKLAVLTEATTVSVPTKPLKLPAVTLAVVVPSYTLLVTVPVPIVKGLAVIEPTAPVILVGKL